MVFENHPRTRTTGRVPPKVVDMRSLRDLKPGEIGTVGEIVGEDAIAVRLMEMGLLEGEQVALITFAPLGDPIEFEVRGYRLSLRAAEAERVRLADSPAP